MSLFGNDLELNIGVPLAAGLNTREFAAVLAHEMGHCTQAFAMRLVYAIERIDRWFLRVVYERDTWDESLDEWTNSVEGWLTVVVVCVNVAVSVSRRVLWFFMVAGHAASCFLSRQMEFHADRCAMSVAGSAGLESLLFRLRELSIIHGLGYQQLKQLWTKSRNLPDSVAEFLHEFEKRLPPDFRDQARLTLINEPPGFGLHTPHPCNACRRLDKKP